jgi:hypothetical protein
MEHQRKSGHLELTEPVYLFISTSMRGIEVTATIKYYSFCSFDEFNYTVENIIKVEHVHMAHALILITWVMHR